MIEETIKEAIRIKKPVEFEYVRADKINGKRIGNPHCLFAHPGTKNTAVHIFQTAGVSDSDLSVGLPWRLFIVSFIENLKILEDAAAFSVAEGYNPDSPLYAESIAKV